MTTVGSYIIGLGSILFLYQFCAGFPSEYKFKIKALSFTHMCWVTTKLKVLSPWKQFHKISTQITTLRILLKFISDIHYGKHIPIMQQSVYFLFVPNLGTRQTPDTVLFK